MEDSMIVALYWARSEQAIAESEQKYGAYCRTIAAGIVGDPEDAEECVNGTWLGAWNAIPPHRPAVLRTFLGKITRRIAIDRWRTMSRRKRGGGETALALEELEDCLSGGDVQREIEQKELTEILNRFLAELPDGKRDAFMCRYWQMASIEEIAAAFGWSVSKTKSQLLRTREKLARRLREEGYR